VQGELPKPFIEPAACCTYAAIFFFGYHNITAEDRKGSSLRRRAPVPLVLLGTLFELNFFE
jgi:hypothetical protein